MKKIIKSKEERIKLRKEQLEKINKKVNIFFNKTSKRLKLDEQKFSLLELILLVCVAFVFGVLISEAFVYQKESVTKPSTVASIANQTEMEKVYNTILNSYYIDVDEEQLKEAAINGMFNYLGDNYSVYYNEEETLTFNERVNGYYYGIGIEISYNDNNNPIITKVFENTPASKADIKVGDRFLKVEQVDVSNETLENVVKNIKGKENKTINVTLDRDGVVIEKKIITSKVNLQSVASEVFIKDGKRIGYIYISIFAENTDEQFIKALQDLEQGESGIDSLIIDVRSNVGGHLTSVRNILNQFFSKEEIIYQTNKKDKINKIYGAGSSTKEYPVAVLIDGNSASGSEILAAAFKEVKKADIVGITTFGKGTVQQTLNLTTGGMIKLTVETWLSPLGNEINKVGVTPTTEIELNDDYYNDSTYDKDNQLQKAIEILKDK